MTDITPNHSDLPSRPLWRRLLGGFLWGLLILLAIIAIGWFAWDVIAGRALRREMASIAAAGEPLTFAQLAGEPMSQPSPDDAGPAYAAAMELLFEADQVGDFYGLLRESDDPFWPIPPDGRVLADLLVSDNRFALGMLDRAADLAACNFDMGVDTDFLFLPKLSKARALAKIASIRTRLLVQHHRGDAAVDSLIASLRMTRIFDRQPVLITGLVKIACLSLFVEDVLPILEFGGPSDAALARLEQGLSQAEASIDLRRVWEGERVMSIAMTLPLLPDEKGAAPLKSPIPVAPVNPMQSRVWRPLTRTYLLTLLRHHGRHIAAAQAGWPAPLDAAQQAAASQSSLPWNQLVNIISPSESHGLVQFARVVAGLRCARAAVLVEQYRRRTGQLPESLDVLAGQSGGPLPSDPFTGKPLLYHKTVSGFVIYSVDQDRRDDGGRRYDGNTGDWPVRVRLRMAGNTSQPVAE